MSSSPYSDPNIPSLRPNKRRKSPYESSDKMSDSVDPRAIINSQYPKDLEPDILCLIFELGLAHSSPKVLMNYMPQAVERGLSSEHIKSHLQKYRIHHERSKEEFISYYNQYIKEQFDMFEQSREWESDGSTFPEQSIANAILPSPNPNAISPRLTNSATRGSIAAAAALVGQTSSSQGGNQTGAISGKRPPDSVSMNQKLLALQQADELLKEWANTHNEGMITQEKARLLFHERTQQIIYNR